MLACCSLLGLLRRCQRVIFQKWGASKQPCRQATVSQTEIPATNTSRHAFHGPADWAERINQQMAVFPCFVPDPQTLLLLASLQGNGVRVCICFTTFLPNACGMLIKFWFVSFYHCWLQRNLANLSATLPVIRQNNGPVLSSIWQPQQSLCSQAGILQSSHTNLSFKEPISSA